MQEEFRRNTRDRSSSKNEGEEDCALATKAKKGKGKIFHSKSKSKYGKKCDMSRVKSFHCHKHGNYATNYPQNKKNKKVGGSVAGEALASQFELDFSLIACMVSSALGLGWYLGSGASFHITGDKKLFNDLEEKDLHMHIEMSDDG